MADNFDLRKFITEAKLKIKVPVKEMARVAKEKYKLNSDFPQLKDRIKNPSNFKLDRKQQVINYFIQKAKDENINPMKVELLKSDIEKNAAPGVNWSFTPDIRNQLLQQQNDYGMKLTSIGDQIALGAIRTGLQADQYANQLTSSYFNNIMRTLSGTPTVTQTTQTTTTGGQ